MNVSLADIQTKTLIKLFKVQFSNGRIARQNGSNRHDRPPF